MIEDKIKFEAGDNKIYEQCLRQSYEHYKNNSKDELLALQKEARERNRAQGSKNETVADCMIVYFLLEELKD